MIWIGMGIAAGVIALDLALKQAKARFRTPVLAVAVGIYLPLELGTAILLGGGVYALARWLGRRNTNAAPSPAPGTGKGLLLAAGLITGEALVGILLAIPIALAGGDNPMSLELADGPLVLPGMALLGVVLVALYVVARKDARA
jgi:uncharacterized oligopeptide transporter (OPT) family protein